MESKDDDLNGFEEYKGDDAYLTSVEPPKITVNEAENNKDLLKKMSKEPSTEKGKFTEYEVAAMILKETKGIEKHHSSGINISSKSASIHNILVVYDGFNNKNITESIPVEFSMHPKLYPFTPPKVRFVDSKLDYMCMFRLTNLTMLQIEYWNPTTSLEHIVLKMKELIDKHGVTSQVKTDNNGIEQDIIELVSIGKFNLSGKYAPIDLGDYPKVDMSANNTVGNRSSKKKKEYWKKGIGYGYDGNSKWNIEEYIKAQEDRDINIDSVIKRISEKMGKMNSNSIHKLLEQTPLVSYLIVYLTENSILHISNMETADNIITILEKICHPKNEDILTESGLNKKSLFTCIMDMDALMNTTPSLFFAPKKGKDTSFDEWLLKTKNGISKMRSILSKFVKHKSEEKTDIDMSDATRYCKEMEPYKFGEHDILENGFYAFATSLPSAVHNRKHLQKELLTLPRDLPINYCSSICVRYDPSNIACMKALIFAPDDTPYANGGFCFDIMFPADYPNVPPNIAIVTTGGGSVRFNPNLYDSGKVCLSLLGTWRGGSKSEEWNPKTSTILQVLISIQALIFIKDPYFNEPGYEQTIGDAAAMKKSRDYDENIRYYTMQYAILDPIKTPPKAFADVNKHFKLKKKEILKQCKLWVDNCYSENKTKFTEKYTEIEKLL